MCGEYTSEQWRKENGQGSPPRVRGILARPVKPSKQPGITPACAGNTSYFKNLLPLVKDHPRVCGEYKSLGGNGTGEKGSPPRVRGIHIFYMQSLWMPRITPACAGNTIQVLSVTHNFQDHPRVCGEYRLVVHHLRYSRDHPRVCGEYLPLIFGLPALTGSPPRVRGIQQ